MQHPTLYKRDSKGKIREWFMEVDGAQYRTIAGLQDGEKVTSGWTTAEAKNVGKVNETSPEEQAVLEVEAQYKKKLSTEYFESVDAIDTPKIFKPMLAASWDKRKDKIDYNEPIFVQPKLDGIRCIINIQGAWTRTGKPIESIPHIIAALQPVFRDNPRAVFDGELYNHVLKHDFNEIVSMVRKQKPSEADLKKSAEMVQYHVYDFPSCDDVFFHRTKILGELVYGVMGSYDKGIVQVVDTTVAFSEKDIDNAYGTYLEQGYEGGIVRLNGHYQQKRSNYLIKRKDFEDDEFEIVRIEEGNGNWAGVAKRVFFKNNDEEGTIVGAGLKGSKDYAKHVLDNAEDYIGKQVTVQFFTRTPDGIPRFPIAKQLHEDQRW